MTPDPLRDRFRGALVGTLVGDALGMPVEGWSGERIRSRLGEVREMRDARLGAGTFTDDTQMAGALVGARNGASAFPDRWLRAVETGEEGLDRLVDLADRLYQRVEGGPG